MLSKEQLLHPLIALRRNSAIVITTMGVVRPWARLSSSDLDFASGDSAMGHAADFALGIALAQPHRQVICLNGDGSMLMSLGTLATIIGARANNFVLFVLHNGTYEITGNQPIPAGKHIDFAVIARGIGFERVYSFSDPVAYSECLPEALSGKGPVFVAVFVEAGQEGPISRGEREDLAYLKPSLAESALRLRQALTASGEAFVVTY